MSEPIKIHRHGQKTWCNMDMDVLRGEECLCFCCAHGVRGTKTCARANQLYAICVADAMAMMITRCGGWAALPKGDETCAK
jgi:hypothetical protein